MSYGDAEVIKDLVSKPDLELPKIFVIGLLFHLKFQTKKICWKFMYGLIDKDYKNIIISFLIF